MPKYMQTAMQQQQDELGLFRRLCGDSLGFDMLGTNDDITNIQFLDFVIPNLFRNPCIRSRS